ncbi:hypothetical protein L2E82_40012 [Cichorium intybus]|uniref:Uncharacterized protein n=1 Tax=Cichorium intybus TaxID=13427 RepID=A0ACB9AKG6_CICIN|nr:hypothetical protein L2E82_40012 [Cichorium intybus]
MSRSHYSRKLLILSNLTMTKELLVVLGRCKKGRRKSMINSFLLKKAQCIQTPNIHAFVYPFIHGQRKSMQRLPVL